MSLKVMPRELIKRFGNDITNKLVSFISESVTQKLSKRSDESVYVQVPDELNERLGDNGVRALVQVLDDALYSHTQTSHDVGKSYQKTIEIVIDMARKDFSHKLNIALIMFGTFQIGLFIWLLVAVKAMLS
jgi:hypothetical protein